MIITLIAVGAAAVGAGYFHFHPFKPNVQKITEATKRANLLFSSESTKIETAVKAEAKVVSDLLLQAEERAKALLATGHAEILTLEQHLGLVKAATLSVTPEKPTSTSEAK